MKLLKISLSIIIVLVNYSFAETIKIACVGDSITFGAGIKDRKNMNYPIQLGKILGEKYEIKNFGNSGSTMLKKGDKPYWKQREFKAALEFNPNIVVIKLGTNDTKPQNWKHGADYFDDYKSMISIFSNLSSKPKIYICLPVPVVESRWGITDDIVNEKIIPTGDIEKVQGTPFDFMNSKKIGRDIDLENNQLILGNGYDHCWVLNDFDGSVRKIASADSDQSGIQMDVFTDQPGVQLYTGNFLNGSIESKQGLNYEKRSGFCLETQHFPDSPNKETFPNVYLNPGEVFKSKTVFKFIF